MGLWIATWAVARSVGAAQHLLTLPSNSVGATPRHRALEFRPRIALQMRFAIDSFTSPLNIPIRLPPRSIASIEAMCP